MAPFLRYTVIGSLFLIPFVPLVVANTLFFPFISGKGFVFRILVEAAFAAWAVLALIDVRYRPRFSSVFALFAALVAWTFIADLAGMNPHKAFWSNYERMDGWVTLIHVFLFFVVAGAFLSAENLWRKWWLAFIAGSAVVCAYGALQLMGAFEIHQGGVRLDATFGNAAYLAAYLLFAIAVTLWRAFESKEGLRYALFALAFVQCVMLYYTATRGAILGFIGAAVVVTALYAFESKGRARKISLIVLAAIAAIVIGFFLVRNTPLVGESGTLNRLASISLESGAARISIWKMAGEGISERPVLGWGQEGFNYVFNTHYAPSMYMQEPWFDRAHNVYLDWGIAAGIPAMLLFIALLITSVVLLYARGAESTKAERVFLTGVLAAYAFQALFVFDNLFTYVPLAAVFAMAHAARAKKVPAVERAPVLSDHAATAMATPIAIASFLVVMWVVNVPSILAGNRLVHALSAGADVETGLALLHESAGLGSFASQEIAEQAVTYATSVASSPDIPAPAKSALASYALTLMGEQVARNPDDTRLRLQYANAYRATGDIEGAVRETRQARELSPAKQQTYIQEGMFEWERKNYQAAAALFDAAYELDPSFAEVAIYKVAGRYLTGRAEEGRDLLLSAFATTTVDNSVLMYAYYESGNYADLARLWELRVQAGTVEDRYQLAFAYKLAGRLPEALALAERTMQEYPNTRTLGEQVLAELRKP